jgi:hypothetical protein
MTLNLVCSKCGEEFNSERFDKSTDQEPIHEFARLRVFDAAIICNDCYEKLKKWLSDH